MIYITETLNSSDIAGDASKWDLDMQVFELKPQLCQELNHRDPTHPTQPKTQMLSTLCSLKSHWRNHPSNNLKTYTLHPVMADAEVFKKASQKHWEENLAWLTGVWLQVFSHTQDLQVFRNFGGKTHPCKSAIYLQASEHVASEDEHFFLKVCRQF